MNIFVNVGGFIRDGFFKKATIERLEKMGHIVRYCGEGPLFGEELRKELVGMDVVMTGWGQRPIHKEDLADVKLVAHTGGTVGGLIDTDVFEAGIPVLSGNQYYAESVAEGVISYMLFALRDMGFYTSELKAGRWQPTFTEGLLDRTVGIVSLGAISRLVIRHLQSFRCHVKVYSTRRDPEFQKEMGFEYADLDDIFKTCDIISIHTARNPETFHMINAHHFSLIKDGALFINTSRGEVIDEDALVEELKKNRFRAVLDVYNKEPLPQDHPLITLPNAILFPHQCGPTYDRRDWITNRLLDDIEAFFRGEPMKNQIPLETARRMTH